MMGVGGEINRSRQHVRKLAALFLFLFSCDLKEPGFLHGKGCLCQEAWQCLPGQGAVLSDKRRDEDRELPTGRMEVSHRAAARAI